MMRNLYSLFFVLGIVYSGYAQVEEDYDSVSCWKDAMDINEVSIIVPSGNVYTRPLYNHEHVDQKAAALLCLGSATKSPIECFKQIDRWNANAFTVARLCVGSADKTPANCWNKEYVLVRKNDQSKNELETDKANAIAKCQAINDAELEILKEKDPILAPLLVALIEEEKSAPSPPKRPFRSREKNREEL